MFSLSDIPFKDVILPILTFILGFLIRTFIPTRKERFDIKSHQAKVSLELLKERQSVYTNFSKLLKKSSSLKTDISKDEKEKIYWDLREAADIYFAQIDMIASYVRRGDIDKKSAKQDHIDELEKVAFKVVPKYFQVIEKIAQENEFPLTERLNDGTCRNLRLFIKEQLGRDGYNKLKRNWGLFT